MTTTTVRIDPDTGELTQADDANTAAGTVTGTASTSSDAELFDTKPFELGIPKLDGHKADKLVLAFGGSIELDRTDEDDLELLERFRLGEDVALAVTARVAGKGFVHAVKGDEGEEIVTNRVILKVHSLDVPESAE